MNFGFVDALRASPNGHLCTGGAMPINEQTRSSSAPTVRATYEPNENPAAHSSIPGYRDVMKSSDARKSSISPGPLSHVPELRPTPRKLKRNTAQPVRAN